MDPPTPKGRRGAGGDPGHPAPDLVHHLRAALLSFFDARARDLPWRRTADPYRIWVSEIMLQQTRVDTVVPYYERWMERFPDVEALAAAELDEVLKLWEGLGYYRRARMLHRAALLVRDGGGALPDTAESLGELPGVGDYTAGAVASIAFGRPEPAVDGNVRRVLARLFDLPDPTPAELRGLAAALVPADRPGDFNQALMELGATVCTPRDPECPACPVAGRCHARAAGVQDERPAPRRRPDVPRIELGVAVAVRGATSGGGWTAALVRRPEDEMLGGLWEFPGAEMADGEGGLAAARRAAGLHGIVAMEPVGELPVVDHAYSHLKARYRPYLLRVAELGPEGEPAVEPDAAGDREGRRRRSPGVDPGQPERSAGGPSWMDRAALADAALPRAQRIIADALVEALDGRPEAGR